MKTNIFSVNVTHWVIVMAMLLMTMSNAHASNVSVKNEEVPTTVEAEERPAESKNGDIESLQPFDTQDTDLHQTATETQKVQLENERIKNERRQEHDDVKRDQMFIQSMTSMVLGLVVPFGFALVLTLTIMKHKRTKREMDYKILQSLAQSGVTITPDLIRSLYGNKTASTSPAIPPSSMPDSTDTAPSSDSDAPTATAKSELPRDASFNAILGVGLIAFSLLLLATRCIVVFWAASFLCGLYFLARSGSTIAALWLNRKRNNNAQ